jgi:hypothetical protein
MAVKRQISTFCPLPITADFYAVQCCLLGLSISHASAENQRYAIFGRAMNFDGSAGNLDGLDALGDGITERGYSFPP